jgi:hypothetical protein
LTITANQGTVVNTTLSPATYYTHSERVGWFQHNLDLFSDPEGDTVSLDHTFSPSLPQFTYTNANRTVDVGAVGDANVGNYTFTLIGHDGHTDTTNATQSMTIVVLLNQPPVASGTLSDVSLTAYYDFELDWSSFTFTDPDVGDPVETEVLTDFSDTSWFTIDNTVPKISGAPVNAVVGNNTVTLRVHDTLGKETLYPVNVEVLENFAPV